MALLATVVISSVCRAVGAFLGFEGATERHNIVWNTALPELDPPGGARDTIYV